MVKPTREVYEQSKKWLPEFLQELEKLDKDSDSLIERLDRNREYKIYLNDNIVTCKEIIEQYESMNRTGENP